MMAPEVSFESLGVLVEPGERRRDHFYENTSKKEVEVEGSELLVSHHCSQLLRHKDQLCQRTEDLEKNSREDVAEFFDVFRHLLHHLTLLLLLPLLRVSDAVEDGRVHVLPVQKPHQHVPHRHRQLRLKVVQQSIHKGRWKAVQGESDLCIEHFVEPSLSNQLSQSSLF